jgi:hypothetical protein
VASRVAILPLNSCGFLSPHTYADVCKAPEAAHKHNHCKYQKQATNTNLLEYLKQATNKPPTVPEAGHKHKLRTVPEAGHKQTSYSTWSRPQTHSVVRGTLTFDSTRLVYSSQDCPFNPDCNHMHHIKKNLHFSTRCTYLFIQRKLSDQWACVQGVPRVPKYAVMS